ncbi:MAG: PstS family phosphate ABC transporter substrate-binding protein [Candidatus Brocadiales bacterium]|nr:PstS family phosphate ABC transporter substrate-binding protein [Candidatus Bathyanammoxibius amoris]
MKTKNERNSAHSALAFLIVTVFCISLPLKAVLADDLKGRIRIDGSSTVYPITEAVAEEFQVKHPRVRITIGVSGTGGGFKKFSRGEVDITNASRPIKPSEVKMIGEKGIEYIELPVAYDGLAVMVNPKNTWCDSLTVEELKKIWEPEAEEKIMKWNQIRPEWPDKKLRLFGPGVDSGTFDYFTEIICGESGASRGDFTPSEDDNILVQGIANDEGALGYFGLAYYEANKDMLKLIGVDDGDASNGDGPVKASLETVENNTYQPLSRPLFIYVSKEAAGRPETVEFIDFYMNSGGPLVEEVGFIPLSDRAYLLVDERFKRGETGSIFAGKKDTAGVSVEDLLSK